MMKPSTSNFERKFRRAIKNFGEEYFQAAIVDVLFESFETHIPLDNFVRAVTSSAEGHGGSALGLLGSDFLLEFAIKDLKS